MYDLLNGVQSLAIGYILYHDENRRCTQASREGGFKGI